MTDHLYAQDAAISVAYAVDVWLNDSAESCVKCLEQAYNVADSVALNQIVPNGVIDLEAEQRVLQHYIVQAELARQAMDIEISRRGDPAIRDLRLKAQGTQMIP